MVPLLSTDNWLSIKKTQKCKLEMYLDHEGDGVLQEKKIHNVFYHGPLEN